MKHSRLVNRFYSNSIGSFRKVERHVDDNDDDTFCSQCCNGNVGKWQQQISAACPPSEDGADVERVEIFFFNRKNKLQVFT